MIKIVRARERVPPLENKSECTACLVAACCSVSVTGDLLLVSLSQHISAQTAENVGSGTKDSISSQ